MLNRPGLAVMTVALACTGVAACAEEDPAPELVTIGVAAAPSLSEAFTEIIDVFEAERPNVNVSMELGRSNEIAQSLSSRSDINVFAAASEQAMEIAVSEGSAVDPQIFARNHVVLAVPSGNPRNITELHDLAREDVRVGLCDPIVPCGIAADTLLSAADVTLTDVERSAGSRALTAQLADNRLDVGVVYRTDVASSRGWVALADVGQHERDLERAAGATNYILARVPADDAGSAAEAETAASDEFVELVLSARGRQALRNSGLEATAR